MIRISAFRWVPPFAQGLVRDLRVRWALEESGLPHEVNLIGPDDQKSASYRAQQPFGQVPAIDDDGLVLFESGAIVLHFADRSPALMPDEAALRERVRTWVFAALNTIEPPIMMLNVIDFQPDARTKNVELRENVMKRIQTRLDGLSAFLGDREYLIADRFTAADLMMTTVLRILRTTDLVDKMPALDAYRQRSEARPAFQRALSAQMATFAANAPAEATGLNKN